MAQFSITVMLEMTLSWFQGSRGKPCIQNTFQSTFLFPGRVRYIRVSLDYSLAHGNQLTTWSPWHASLQLSLSQCYLYTIKPPHKGNATAQVRSKANTRKHQTPQSEATISGTRLNNYTLVVLYKTSCCIGQ